ncbi:ATP-binding protein [Thalassotalea euphylliae]|uniref:ATP-binding protein n=1 Tax=Thalassotalea euphylliae TaxID=1655234 RepID=UPI00363D7FF1
MANHVVKQLSSIKIKLFLWFWLVTICAIAATRFVSVQLSQQHIQVTLDEEDLSRLHMFVDGVNRFQPADLKTFIKALSKRARVKMFVRHIVVQNINTGELLLGDKRHQQDIENFLDNTLINEPSTWLIPRTRLTGPLEFSLNDQEFRVFYQRKFKHPNSVGAILMQLPPWARFGTPLLVSFILCWFLARSLSKPLSDMANVAHRFGQGDLKARVQGHGNRNDELGELAKNFNDMAEQLSVNVSAHQRLMADVSHELRSPLTRLQMAIALSQKNQDNAAELETYLGRCEQEIDKLDSMIDHVLVLSRLENSTQPINIAPCAISPLIDSIVDDAAFLGQDKQVDVSLKRRINADLMVKIDSQLIASAISNIINNAVKYSPERSVVSVCLEQKETNICITISDQGDGVPAASIPRLFEPFYRVADARDRASGGTGLGLAIAKQSILAHQGSIVAENIANGGLLVRIVFPVG